MFMSIRKICNQTAKGTGLGPVTFPGMEPLTGKYASEMTKNSHFLR